MAQITIRVDSYEKAKYQHWCVDQARGSMSAALRLLVQQIIQYQPTWAELDAAMSTLREISND